jgi:hypothetical protein
MADNEQKVKDFTKAVEEMNESLERQQRLASERTENIKQYIEQLGKEADEIKVVLAAKKKLELAEKIGAENVEELRKEYEFYRESLSEVDEAIIKQTESLNDNSKALEKNRKELAEKKKQLEAEKKALEESNKIYEKRKKILGEVAAGMDTLAGTQVSNLFSLKGLISAGAAYMHQLDAQRVSLRKATGQVNSLTDNLNDMMNANDGLYLSLEENTQVLSSLSTGMTKFLALSGQQQSSVQSLSKLYFRLGADAGSTATMFDKLGYAFNLTTEQALSAGDGLISLSTSIGRPIAEVQKDLIELAPELSRFGSRGIQVFEKLAVQARQLGLSVKQAFDMSELFDTFESSANVAGRLNAQLGLQLNSVELMKASSEERIQLLRQEFALQGKNIDTMGRRQQQMIASILGTDVESARRLLGDAIGLEQFQKPGEEKTDSQNIARMTTLQQKVQVSQEKMFHTQEATLTAVIESGNKIVNALQPILGQILKTLIVMSVAGAFGAARLLRPNVASTYRAPRTFNLNRTSPTQPAPNASNISRVTRTSRPTGGTVTGSGRPTTPTPTPSTGGGSGGMFSRMGAQAAGRAGLGGGALMGVFSGFSEYSRTGDLGHSAKYGAISGTAAAAGTALGAVIGGPLGAFVGGYLGSMAGDFLASTVMGDPKKKETDQMKATQDIRRFEQEGRRSANEMQLNRGPVNLNATVKVGEREFGQLQINNLNKAFGL